MQTADQVLAHGIEDHRYAAAAARVSIAGRVVHQAVIGDAVHTGDERVPLWEEALFDIASLTKVVGTTAALMALVTQGRVGVDDLVSRYLVRPNPAITLRHLLTHRAGVAEWQPLYLAAQGRLAAARLVGSMPLRYPVGEGRHYSDLGMVILGRVVEQLTGSDLDIAVESLVTGPLGLDRTGFGPVSAELAVAGGHGDDIEQAMIRDGEPWPVTLKVTRSPTWRTGWVRGEVSDGNAFHAMDGVSGHAGLFSTLDDLARFGAALLDGSPVASRAVRDQFLHPGADAQALGFWWRETAGGTAYWHSGFTGTRLLVEPARGVVAVLLTNRLHVMAPGARVGPDVAPVWEAYLAATGVTA